MDVTCEVLFYKVDFPSANSLADPITQTLCQQTSLICSLPIKYIWLLHESLLHRLERDFVAVKPFFEVAVSEATCSRVIRDKANTGRQSAACEPLQRNNNALGACSFERMRAHHLSKDIRVGCPSKRTRQQFAPSSMMSLCWDQHNRQAVRALFDAEPLLGFDLIGPGSEMCFCSTDSHPAVVWCCCSKSLAPAYNRINSAVCTRPELDPYV